MKNRKKIEEHVLKYIGKIDRSGINVNMYKTKFSEWSDNQFKQWLETLKRGEGYVTLLVPTAGEVKLDVANNIAIGKELGVEFFQGFDYTTGDLSYKVTTPTLIAHYNMRRLKQHAVKGLSVPDDNNSRNTLTGQVTGKSKTGRLTNPEIDVLIGRGLHETIRELLGTRGGNITATRQLVDKITTTGEVRIKDLEPYMDGRTSVKSLTAIFKAMHIEVNF